MPKPSSNPDQAQSGGDYSKIEAGRVEVSKARFANLKIGNFADSVTQLYLVLTAHTIDASNAKVRDADPLTLNISLGKQTLTSESSKQIHPGQATNPADPEPKDLGTDANAEGNTIYGTVTPHNSCAYTVFNASLAKAGFSKYRLGLSWAPDYEGMQFKFETLPSSEVNGRFGTRLNVRPIESTNNKGEKTSNVATYKIVTEWINKGYLEAKDGGGTSSSTPDGKSGGKASSSSATVEQMFEQVLGSIAAKFGEKGKKVKSKQQLIGYFNSAYMAAKLPNPKMKPVLDIFNNEDKFTKMLDKFDISVEGDGAINFPIIAPAEAEDEEEVDFSNDAA